FTRQRGQYRFSGKEARRSHRPDSTAPVSDPDRIQGTPRGDVAGRVSGDPGILAAQGDEIVAPPGRAGLGQGSAEDSQGTAQKPLPRSQVDDPGFGPALGAGQGQPFSGPRVRHPSYRGGADTPRTCRSRDRLRYPGPDRTPSAPLAEP